MRGPGSKSVRRNVPWVGVVGVVIVAWIVALAIRGPDTTRAASDLGKGMNEAYVTASDPVAAGRYIITIAGCHDCHTPGFMEKGLAVPESEWLKGLPLGWRGPWGTTYGANLRRTVELLSEEAFVKMMRTREGRPPHPWPGTQAMSDRDLRAVYQYIKTLKPVGEPMPAYVPPDQEPQPPYFLLDPEMAARAAKAGAQAPAR